MKDRTEMEFSEPVENPVREHDFASYRNQTFQENDVQGGHSVKLGDVFVREILSWTDAGTLKLQVEVLQWRLPYFEDKMRTTVIEDYYLSKIGFRDLLDSFDSHFRHQLKIDLIPNSETMRTKDYNYNINIHIFLFG